MRVARARVRPAPGPSGAPDQTFAEFMASLAPVAWWPMGEASGNIIDAIGALDGVGSGTPTYGQAGGVDGDDAISFSGGDSFAVPDGAALDITDGDFSVVVVAARNETATTDYQTFFSKGNAGNLYLQNHQLSFDNDGSEILRGSATTEDTDYHLFAITIAGGGAGAKVAYKDGVAGTTAGSGTCSDNASAMSIGVYHGGGLDANMRMQHLAFFDRILTAQEIADLQDARDGIAGGGGDGAGNGDICGGSRVRF